MEERVKEGSDKCSGRHGNDSKYNENDLESGLHKPDDNVIHESENDSPAKTKENPGDESEEEVQCRLRVAEHVVEDFPHVGSQCGPNITRPECKRLAEDIIEPDFHVVGNFVDVLLCVDITVETAPPLRIPLERGARHFRRDVARRRRILGRRRGGVRCRGGVVVICWVVLMIEVSSSLDRRRFLRLDLSHSVRRKRSEPRIAIIAV